MIYSYYATQFHQAIYFEAWNFAFVNNAAECLRSKFKNLVDLKLSLFFLSHFSFVKEERYCQAVKSLEFDRQLGPYNLSQYGDWKHLSNYITKSIIERIGLFHLTTLGALNTAIYYEFLYHCRLCLIYYLFSICVYVSFSINFSFSFMLVIFRCFLLTDFLL